MDTNGAEESVIVSEVSSFQGLKCMRARVVLGVGKGVLFREVSSVQLSSWSGPTLCVILYILYTYVGVTICTYM